MYRIKQIKDVEKTKKCEIRSRYILIKSYQDLFGLHIFSVD